ncbi:hypothetical protein [Leptodesmis sp.]|uniref:hypothetical protein n=1 Tax=Leptodesmis sp. TaxID=3100501 RepID=UPI0040534EA0
MQALTRTSTTEMEVTSIRLERELKEKLKELSGNQGYQALIRDILWNYVQQRSGDYTPSLSPADIRSIISATAQQEQLCALTGKVIHPNEQMLLGLTTNGVMVSLSSDSLSS